MGRLDGRIAFVTGGACGIGRAIAGKFAVERATATFADLDEAAGLTTADELAADGLSVTFPLRRMAEPVQTVGSSTASAYTSRR